MNLLRHGDYLWKSRDMGSHHQSIFPTTLSKNCWKTLHNFEKQQRSTGERHQGCQLVTGRTNRLLTLWLNCERFQKLVVLWLIDVLTLVVVVVDSVPVPVSVSVVVLICNRFLFANVLQFVQSRCGGHELLRKKKINNADLQSAFSAPRNQELPNQLVASYLDSV